MSASKELKAGIFVIAATTLAVGGVIALGSGKLFKATEMIETSTIESVTGLQIGSPVRFRGVPIGEVSEIAFADRCYPDEDLSPDFDYASPVVIRMKVRVDVFGPERSELFTKDLARGVAKGLRARMKQEGLTGGIYVELDLLDPKQFPEPELACVPLYPFVPSAPSVLSQLIANVELITKHLAELDFGGIGRSVDKVLKDIDSTVVGKIDPGVDEIRAFVADVRETNRRLQAIVDDPAIARTLANVESLSGDLAGTVGETKGSIRETIEGLPRILASLEQVVTRVDGFLDSDDMRSIVANLRSASGELGPAIGEYRDIGAAVEDFLASEMAEIRQLVAALAQAAQNIAELTDQAKKDPPQVLFGAPPPRLAPGAPAPNSSPTGGTDRPNPATPKEGRP
jgi:ABC-type transporter Mla subunit MlaD